MLQGQIDQKNQEMTALSREKEEEAEVATTLKCQINLGFSNHNIIHAHCYIDIYYNLLILI